MVVMNKQSSNQQGIVALLTTIIVSILLLIITLGALSLVSGELRQATDYDQSITAFFAAEAGVEDAVAEINRRLSQGLPLPENSDCTPLDAADAQLGEGVEYTCQVITADANELTDQLGVEEATQLDLAGATGYDSIRVRWNDPSAGTDPAWSGVPLPANFTQGDDWQSGDYPAVIEMLVVSYPNGDFNETDIQTQTVVLKPTSPGGSNSANLSTLTSLMPVSCDPGSFSGYDCEASITGLSGSSRNYVVRLYARYAQAKYELQAINSSTGNIITIPGAQTIIDVTGRAGDVSRRIQVRVPTQNQIPINQAILVDENLCKVLQVSGANGSASSEDGCT